MMGITLLLLLSAWTLFGCSNIPAIVKELARSDRSWCLSAIGYGENIKVGGSGVQTGDMSCGDAGLSLKSQATHVGVPLTIVPQMTIGQPTLGPATRTDGR